MTDGADPATFLSGEHGHVAGIGRRARRAAADRVLDLRTRLRFARTLDRLAEAVPQRAITATGIYRPGCAAAMAAIAEQLHATRHALTLRLGATGDPDPALAEETSAAHLPGGKFQNLNAALADALEADWLLVVDDDVALPPRFLDRLIGLCERFDLALAQPAQSLSSHAAWAVTRRRGGSLVRETNFVEIGPVTVFRADAASELLPFPELRFGWGLDLHWSALARERGWRLGIADALPVRHETAPVAADYDPEEATAEASRFLADRPYVTSAEAQETLAQHASAR